MERNLLRYYIYGIYKRTSDAYSSSAPENTSVKGWALKRDRKNTLFSDNVKEYLKVYSMKGKRMVANQTQIPFLETLGFVQMRPAKNVSEPMIT